MAVNYAVRAEVIDIRGDKPKDTDVLLVDTNVWLWMCYGRASLSLNLDLRQLTTYPSYLKRALTAKARLHRFNLSFAELSHQIEKVEHEYFVRTNSRNLSLKEFRHNELTNRAKVVAEIGSAWQQVKTLAPAAELTLNDSTTDKALARLSDQLIDGHDTFFLESLSSANCVKVVSDDGDFCTVPGITLFTANPSAIAAAKAQGKLLFR